jgi:hypothetical protein
MPSSPTGSAPTWCDRTARTNRPASARSFVSASGRGRHRHPQDQLSLEQHGGRTRAGVFARTAQRLLALDTAIWHNWHTGATVKRSLIA